MSTNMCLFLYRKLTKQITNIIIMCVQWTEKNSTKLAGVGKVVEIDEAKFGKRKYNRGVRRRSTVLFGRISLEKSS